MSDKTEKPTPKRLRDSRKKGQVANSKDVTSTALLIIIFVYLGLSRDFCLKSLIEMICAPGYFYTYGFEEALSNSIALSFMTFIKIVFPLLALVLFTGIASNFLQIGPLLAAESIKPNLNKLNPVGKLKQIFSMKNCIELIKSTIKIIFLSVLLYNLIKNAIDPLLKIPYVGLQGIFDILTPLLKKFAYYVCFAYIAIAVADFVFQRHDHMKKLRMSKSEVKREYKEMEGDPQIKGKRKQLHREMLSEDPGARTKQSSVLVTNPTRYAIAIFYEAERVALPVVLEKGFGARAKIMIKAAQEAEIPIMENVPLAHALYHLAEPEKFIPRELIEPVAQVLRWVQELKEQKEIA